MSSHRPDHIGIADYLEGTLPPDARRAMRYHLQRCDACDAALEREARLLERLDGMQRFEPPPDFVAAVMGRVAQYPAHRPGTQVPWNMAAGWAAGLSAALLVILIGGFWFLGSSGMLAEAGTADFLGQVVVVLADTGTDVLGFARSVFEPASKLIEVLATAGWSLVSLAARSSWWVQLGLLILTVTMNYAFTRLVLAYQRRH